MQGIGAEKLIGLAAQTSVEVGFGVEVAALELPLEPQAASTTTATIASKLLGSPIAIPLLVDRQVVPNPVAFPIHRPGRRQKRPSSHQVSVIDGQARGCRMIARAGRAEGRKGSPCKRLVGARGFEPRTPSRSIARLSVVSRIARSPSRALVPLLPGADGYARRAAAPRCWSGPTGTDRLGKSSQLALHGVTFQQRMGVLHHFRR